MASHDWPRTLAEQQVTLDAARCRGRPELLGRKWSRMARSPFAFLRGALPVFDAAVARQRPVESGTAQLVGDLHLENFGVFATSPERFALHVNDFDETRVGLVRDDVLRLLASVLLARESLAIDGRGALGLAEAVLDGHQRGVRGVATHLPPLLHEALDDAQAGARDFDGLVDPTKDCIRETPKTPPVPRPLRGATLRAIDAYFARLRPGEREELGRLRPRDVSWRIAGTGSLGLMRLLVLVRGRKDRLWLLDAKESPNGAEAVVTAMRRALPDQPFALGDTTVRGRSMLVRVLAAGEGKLEAERLQGAGQAAALLHLGALAGQIHRRTWAGRPKVFSPAQRRVLLDQARSLAGLHHEVFLEFCALKAVRARTT